MRTFSLRFTICSATLLALFTAGCSTQPATPVTLPVSQATSEADQLVVKRAEYENWIKFAVGTSLTRRREIKNEISQVVEVTKFQLVSKDEKKVVISSQVTVDRENRTLENPPADQEYAASFRLPPGMDAAKFALPDFKATVDGTEKVEVLGQSFDATVYSWNAASEAGPVSNKMWMSDDVPGRVIKHVTECKGVTSSEVVTELNIVKESITK